MAHKPDSIIRRSREGQAMAEFLVGLVCIMLLVVGLQQISILSQQGFTAMNNARHDMALQLADTTFTDWWRFGFAGPTDPGPDGRVLTADDRIMEGDDTFYQEPDGYLQKVDDYTISAYLAESGIYSPHSDLKYSEVYSASEALNMAYSADLQTVELLPFLNKIFQRDSLFITRQLWMPRLDAVK